MKEYESLDAVALAEHVAQGDTSPSELLEAAIQRMEKRDPALGSIAIPMLDEARDAIAAGLPEGRFRGVPFLLKDLHLNVPGVRTTNGCAMFADFVARTESTLSRRYREAGLVTFGRSASPEFGLTTATESRLFGVTRNPWNREHTSGGSSGGASAAVAAGIVPCANASDGGGSIRVPAACCGLFGMKPTRGRTPMGPDKGEGWAGMSAVHVVSRSVRDSAAMLDATAGPEAGAPYQAPLPARPWQDEASRDPGSLRIAVQREPWNGSPVDADCVTALDDAIALCESLGHHVEEAPLVVDPESLGQATTTIIGTSLRATLEARARELGRALREDDVEPGSWMMSEIGRARSAVDYVNAVQTVHAAGLAAGGHLARFDLILSPTMASPPSRVGVLSLSNPDPGARLVPLLQSIGFTQLFNATGQPAMSVPLHWNEAGLPIGIQFAGRFGDEATLFRLAGQLEAARPWFERRPPGLEPL